MNRDDDDKFPVIEQYRGCPIFDYQDYDRVVATVKPSIDAVFEMNDPVELYEYAIDPHHPPESRLLARAKVLAIAETRHIARDQIDIAKLRCHCAGLGTMRWCDYEFYCSSLEYPIVHAPGADLGSFDRRPPHQQQRMREANEQRGARRREEWLRDHPTAF